MRPWTRAGLMAAALAVLSVAGGCSTGTAQVELERSASVRYEEGFALRVRSENGRIEVTRGGTDEIRIDAVVRAQTQDRAERTLVRVEHGAEGVVSLGIDWADGARRSGEGCSLAITIPSASGLDLGTSNGRITAEGLGGAAILRSSNGRIEVRDHQGAVDAETSNGRIVAERLSGSLRAVTSNGSVQASFAAVTGPVEIDTSNGSVTLDFPAGFAGSIVGATSNGSIDAQLPASAQVQTQTKSQLVVRMGDGPGARVATSNGSITVRVPQ